MDDVKVEKIKTILLENPELHVKLVDALGELGQKIGEKVEADELIKAIGSAMKTEGHTTYDHFWAHY